MAGGLEDGDEGGAPDAARTRDDERLLQAMARAGVIVITDADYRCVWRPCPALEEDDDEPAQ